MEFVSHVAVPRLHYVGIKMQMNFVDPSSSRVVDSTWDRRVKRNREAVVSHPAIHMHKDMTNLSGHADGRYV